MSKNGICGCCLEEDTDIKKPLTGAEKGTTASSEYHSLLDDLPGAPSTISPAVNSASGRGNAQYERLSGDAKAAVLDSSFETEKSPAVSPAEAKKTEYNLDLCTAVASGKIDKVIFLLSKGADPTALVELAGSKSSKQESPLHLSAKAAKKDPSKIEIFKKLIQSTLVTDILDVVDISYGEEQFASLFTKTGGSSKIATLHVSVDLKESITKAYEIVKLCRSLKASILATSPSYEFHTLVAAIPDDASTATGMTAGTIATKKHSSSLSSLGSLTEENDDGTVAAAHKAHFSTGVLTAGFGGGGGGGKPPLATHKPTAAKTYPVPAHGTAPHIDAADHHSLDDAANASTMTLAGATGAGDEA